MNNTKNLPELLPCPFCGGVAKTLHFNGTQEATCAGNHKNCAGTDVLVPLKMWNARAAQAMPRERSQVIVIGIGWRWADGAVPPPGTSLQDCRMLTKTEIKEALMSCQSSRTPGIDGAESIERKFAKKNHLTMRAEP